MAKRSPLIVALVSFCVLLSAGCAKGVPDSAMAADSNNVIAIVANTPEYSTMWSVVTAADMRDELYERRETRTVLVPTNDAFTALGQSTIDNLLLEENRAQLEAIIASHIIEESVTAPELAAGEFSANELGVQLSTAKDDTGATTVQGARVIRSIRADDGYVHVIDAVIIPAP